MKDYTDTYGVQRKPYCITKPREKWSDLEHKLFLEAVELHGRNWKQIVDHIGGTRTASQVRSHAQKYFLKMEKSGNLEAVPPPRPKKRPPAPPELEPLPRPVRAKRSARRSERVQAKEKARALEASTKTESLGASAHQHETSSQSSSDFHVPQQNSGRWDEPAETHEQQQEPSFVKEEHHAPAAPHDFQSFSKLLSDQESRELAPVEEAMNLQLPDMSLLYQTVQEVFSGFTVEEQQLAVQQQLGAEQRDTLSFMMSQLAQTVSGAASETEARSQMDDGQCMLVPNRNAGSMDLLWSQHELCGAGLAPLPDWDAPVSSMGLAI